MTKEYVEEKLKDLLDEALESVNQDGSILRVNYDREKQEFTVVFPVVFIPEDDYIGFQSY